jgi:hypothetical protein
MSHKANTWLTVIALTVIVAQMPTGAPQRLASELRSIECCAENCVHRSVGEASKCKCCYVSKPADVAAMEAPRRSAPSSAPLHLPAANASQAGPLAILIADGADWLPGARAAPIFLQVRSLRL